MFNWFIKEKRKTYRIKADSDHQFDIAIICPDGKLYPCRPVDISIDGASASPPADGPDLRRSDTVQLDIFLRSSGKKLRIAAELRDIALEENDRVFRFQFSDPDGLAAKLGNTDFRILNRRQNYRLTPVNPSRIEVTVGWEGKTATGWIVDISVSGMGLGISEKTAGAIGRPARMRLRFQLPGPDQKIQLAGIVQYRKQMGKNYLYGIHFDLNPYGEDRRIEQAIAAFIVKQQQLILQRQFQAKYSE